MSRVREPHTSGSKKQARIFFQLQFEQFYVG